MMLTLFFAYLLSSCLWSSAQAQVRFAPVEGQYQIKGEFDYLYTTANYIPNSSTLFGGGKYTRMLFVAEGSYDYSPALRFYGGINGGQATAVSVDSANSLPGTTVTVSRSNGGINEGYLGGQWWTEFKMFDVVPQIDFVYPFWRVDETSNNPLVGEGALRLQAGSWVMMPTDKFTPFGYVGLTYLDGGRAMELPYSVGVRIGTSKTFFVEGEFRGYAPIGSDSNTDNQAIRDAYLGRAQGGSYEFFALNPNQAEIAGLAGFRFQQFGIYAGAAKTVFGKNSADDWTFTAGLTYNGSTRERPDRLKESDFQQDKESYNPKLFQEQITPPTSDPEGERVMDPPPPPEPQVVQKPQPPPQPKRVKRAAPKRDEPMPNVEMLMKDTQKSLEKKKKSED